MLKDDGETKLTAPEERAERELERIADTGGHQTFRAIVGWLRANRESVRTDLHEMRDEQGRQLESIKTQVTRINGRVADAHKEIGEIKTKDREEKAVEKARKEWAAEHETEDERKTVSHRWRIDLWAGGMVIVAVAVVEVVLHSVGL